MIPSKNHIKQRRGYPMEPHRGGFEVFDYPYHAVHCHATIFAVQGMDVSLRRNLVTP